MTTERAFLSGGPFHGKFLLATSDVVVIPHAAPFNPVITLPARRWWHRILRRPLPFPPEPPAFVNVAYRRTSATRDGNAIYEHEEGTTS
jgi:hypothetical protein